MLEVYRIGNLSEIDVADNDDALKEDDPWINEPQRNRALIVTCTTPFNAETPLLLLAENFITHNELFYIRYQLVWVYVVRHQGVCLYPFLSKSHFLLEGYLLNF